eukprot:3689156-Rhodomonas_salina.2
MSDRTGSTLDRIKVLRSQQLAPACLSTVSSNLCSPENAIDAETMQHVHASACSPRSRRGVEVGFTVGTGGFSLEDGKGFGCAWSARRRMTDAGASRWLVEKYWGWTDNPAARQQRSSPFPLPLDPILTNVLRTLLSALHSLRPNTHPRPASRCFRLQALCRRVVSIPSQHLCR